MFNLKKTDCLAFCDFETTGIDRLKDYPIEIGMVIADSKFQHVAAVDSLIAPPEVPEGYEDALAVHGITSAMLRNAPYPVAVAKQVVYAVERAKASTGASRVILCSDNIVFETDFMRILLEGNGEKWPFHYCGWDLGALFAATGVDKPELPHRAFPDCCLVMDAARSAMSVASHSPATVSAEAAAWWGR